ncbi:MAG: HAD family hydrolase [Acinetobacter sp.]
MLVSKGSEEKGGSLTCKLECYVLFVQIYLATNQEHNRIAYLIEHLNLDQYFDDIYYSAALGCRKPDISFFKKVEGLSGFLPEQLLLIDDTVPNIIAAQSLGWEGVHWLNHDALSNILLKL